NSVRGAARGGRRGNHGGCSERIRGSAAVAALPNDCSLLPPAAINSRRASRAPHLVGRRCACRSRSVRLAHHDCADRLLALALVALALAGAARAAAADPPRPPRELRLLVVLAGFPDRPLAKTPAHFARQLSRFVAYWTEVSSAPLRIGPTG